MLIGLPLLFLILLFVILQTYKDNWRVNLLNTLIIWGFLLTIITEFLSLFKAINIVNLSIAWFLINSILILSYWKRNAKLIRTKQLITWLKDKITSLSSFSKILLLGIIFIALAVGIIVIVAAPNNWDSMTYHMSRVVHWMQNQSVNHYPTHTIKQLYQNPWAEFVILHFQILSKSDRFANFVQWGSMIGSLIGVSLISHQLGANIRGQILAAVVCATIPMGILQASSTQNDYVVSFWLVCFAYFTLLIIQEGASLTNIFRVGISLGLAILTKGTAYIYALPFCIWLGVWGLKNLRFAIWKPVLLVSAIVISLNWGHYSRNLAVFASPLGAADEGVEASITLPIFISNLTRNLSLHADIVRNLFLQKFITPTTGITEKLIKIIHEFIGLDVSDPRITSPSGTKFHVPGISTSEDTAGNPLHLLLIFIATFLLFINPYLRKHKVLISYFLAILTGFLLFCLLLTWSPWRSRLHLPFFVLFSAFVGYIFSKSFNVTITNILAIFLLLISQNWVFNNQLKPLIGQDNIFSVPRIEQFFQNKAYLKNDYQEATRIVIEKQCRKIGLTGDAISYEYPLWVLIEPNATGTKIHHINVTNESAKMANQYPYEKLAPCAIIAVNSGKSQKNLSQQLKTQYGIYHQSWLKGAVQIFTKNEL